MVWCELELEDHPFLRSIDSTKCLFLFSSISSFHPGAKSVVRHGIESIPSSRQHYDLLPSLLPSSSVRGTVLKNRRSRQPWRREERSWQSRQQQQLPGRRFALACSSQHERWVKRNADPDPNTVGKINAEPDPPALLTRLIWMNRVYRYLPVCRCWDE